MGSKGGHHFVMSVRHFHGYPVVHSKGRNWGTKNDRDYFVVHWANGDYHRARHLHMRMGFHFARKVVTGTKHFQKVHRMRLQYQREFVRMILYRTPSYRTREYLRMQLHSM